MNTRPEVKYTITRNGFDNKLISKKILLKDLSMELLQERNVFGLTAFISDEDSLKKLVKQMTNVRNKIGWKSEVESGTFESDFYGEGFRVNIMKEAIEPKVTYDDMEQFIASLDGSVSV